MRVIIFGTGKVYLKYREKLSQMDIIVFLDNDIKRQGTYLDGKFIDSPENISKYEYDYILLASVHYMAMRTQLEKQGIDGKLIIDAEHKGYWNHIRKIEVYKFGNDKINAKKVLLVTHDFSLTGAPLMLYYAAKILKNYGYDITVYSKTDGKLKYDYLRNEISVLVFEDYDFKENEIYEYFSQYEIIIVNTVILYKLIEKLKKVNIPILWWLHEEDNVYEEYQIRKLPWYEKLDVYGVSNRAVDSYKKHVDDSQIGQLVYGIPNEAYGKCQKPNKCKSKLVYAIIGCVSERKGHDIFMAAIEKNWEQWREKAEFWVIGIITESQRAVMEATKKVKIFGSVDHNQLMKMYSEIDVIVCPSRNDPMPVVLAEGMMNKKVCIASNMTGTAEKIVPYKNGLICQAGDVDSLSKQIEWILNHRDEMNTIGEKAFNIYKREFSQDLFRKRLLNKVEDLLKKV